VLHEVLLVVKAKTHEPIKICHIEYLILTKLNS